MKKDLFNVMLMLLAILSLGSCSDKKDGALTVFYNVSLSKDMSQMADMAITYRLADGSTATDTITGTSWDKAVMLDTFPAVFGIVDYTFLPKPESNLTKEGYEPSVVFSMFTREAKYELQTELVNIYYVKRDKVAGFIDLVNDHGGTGISKIAVKEGDSISIHDHDTENEKIRLRTDNALKKIFQTRDIETIQ